MKKGTVVSIVFGIMVAANATTEFQAMMRKREELESLFSKHAPAATARDKREPGTCSLIVCGTEGDTCPSSDNSTVCMSNMNCVDGKCEVYVDGSDCGAKSYCPDDMYCNRTEKKCRRRKGEGEVCGSYTKECKEGYFCNETSFSKVTPVCLPNPKKVGDPCLWVKDHCPRETECSDNVCKRYPTRLGAKCDESVGCDDANLTCYNGKCAVAPQKGEKCLDGGCASGYICGDNGVCKDFPKEGEECLMVYPICAEGYYCRFSKCTARPGEGEKCTISGYCNIGLYCNSDDTCVQLPGEGEECQRGTCNTGLVCDYNYETVSICRQPVAKMGENCSDYVGCGAGLVCDKYAKKCIPGECIYDGHCK